MGLNVNYHLKNGLNNLKINNMKKYYIEVIGGAKSLYVVNASNMEINSKGCYIFSEGEDTVALYPINRTIIKSIEDIK